MRFALAGWAIRAGSRMGDPLLYNYRLFFIMRNFNAQWRVAYYVTVEISLVEDGRWDHSWHQYYPINDATGLEIEDGLPVQPAWPEWEATHRNLQPSSAWPTGDTEVW